MKKCYKCELDKPLEEFSKNKTKPDGYCSQCKTCQKSYYKNKHYAKHKQDYIKKSQLQKSKIREFVANYKKDKACIKCGESHIACLQFHHRDKLDKKFEISKSASKSITSLKKEIDKCDILCANCHFKLHYDERMAS